MSAKSKGPGRGRHKTWIGHKRPVLRSLRDLKNYMLEALELHAAGKLTAQEMRHRTASVRETAEVHAAMKVMEMQGISFDLDAAPTMLDYEPVVRRRATHRSGETAKGPIDETTITEERDGAPAAREIDGEWSPKELEDGGTEGEDDEIPW